MTILSLLFLIPFLKTINLFRESCSRDFKINFMQNLQVLLLIIGALFTSDLLLAQDTDLALGQWKSHLPFRKGFDVTQSNTDVYFSAGQGVLRLSKDGTEQERLTKVEGLSSVGVRILGYNKGAETLLVIYESGVIDLLSSEGILTILNIPQSEIVLGEKIIYDLHSANDSITYLASNFGISTMNVLTGKFPSTTKTPLDVEAVTIYNNALYAGTENGVYVGALDGSINLDDFNNWIYLDESFGFPVSYTARSLAVYNDKLYLEVNDSLYSFNGNEAAFVHFQESTSLSYLTSEGKLLVAGFDNPDSTSRTKVFAINESETFEEAPNSCVNRPLNAVEDESGRIWLADAFPNFRNWTPGTSSCNTIPVNAPRSSDVAAIALSGNDLWIASGGIDPTNNSGLANPDGVYSLIEGNWDEYNKFNAFSGLGTWDDLNTLAVHPKTGQIYAGSFTSGLAVFENAELSNTYDKTDSGLDADIGSSNDTRVAGLAFDQEDNLWVSNTNSNTPLAVLRNDGTWKNFTLPCTSDRSTKNIAIDAFGYKWIVLTNSSFGILVFDEGDMNDTLDDRCKIITTANSNLPTNEVRDLALDLDGNMWVGTKQGVIVFECNVLDSDECPGSLRIVEEDNFGAFLLDEEDVISVAIDGANRKWFGTTNGIFVQSPSGEEKVARFTTDNSPLFDNIIQDIAFNHTTGETYIGTVEGLQVYRSDATAGGSTNSSNVNVFPNPVRPEYTGKIAISGLAEDANVKITDVGGLLVYETTALGGQAIWDGRDYTGRKANTGVYIVFATSNNSANPSKAVAKILFIN